MKKDPTIFLEHIMDSILLIEEYADKLTQAEFFKNTAIQDAIIRRLEIMGEAVKNLPKSVREDYPQIPWKQIAGMRDIMIHGYFDIDLGLTWKVVKQELPAIKKSLSIILNKS